MWQYPHLTLLGNAGHVMDFLLMRRTAGPSLVGFEDVCSPV